MNRIAIPGALAVAAALAFAAPAARAQGDFDGAPMEQMGPGGDMHGGMHGFRRGGRGGMESAWSRLDLTQSQKDRLAAIRDEQQRKAIDIERDLKVARLDFGKLMRAENPSTSAIDTQIDKMSTLRARLTKLRVHGRMEMRSVLTPEQREQLKESPRRNAEGRRSRDDGSR